MKLNEYYRKLRKIDHNKFADDHVNVVLNLLLDKEPFGFARFNDGEMMGIDKIGAKVARGDQVVDESLHKALKEAIQYKQENYFVGMPCSSCFPKYAQLAKQLVKQPQHYQLNAVAMTNRNWAKFVINFPDVVGNQKIMWISGGDQNTYFLTTEMGLDIRYHLKFTRKNTWSVYDEVKTQSENKIKDVDIVIVSLGPAARVYVREMFEKYPDKTFIDIGSTFDPFTRDVWHNCHKGWLEKGFNNTKSCKICN
jgi:hypothetical protein